MLHEHGAAGVAHDEVGVVVDRVVRAVVLDRLVGRRRAPVRPGPRLVLRLLCQQGVDDLRGSGAGAPSPVQGQDHNVDPFGQVAGGFFDFAQLFADVVDDASGARPRPERAFAEPALALQVQVETEHVQAAPGAAKRVGFVLEHQEVIAGASGQDIEIAAVERFNGKVIVGVVLVRRHGCTC